MARVADPNIPGAEKLGLVENATPADARGNGQVRQGSARQWVRTGHIRGDRPRMGRRRKGHRLADRHHEARRTSRRPARLEVPDGVQPADRHVAADRGRPRTCCSRSVRSRRPRQPPEPRVWIGWLEFDLLLGDVRSLKQKRSAIRPVIAELQRRFAVSAAETGAQDLHRRANVGDGAGVSRSRARRRRARRRRATCGVAAGDRFAVDPARPAAQHRRLDTSRADKSDAAAELTLTPERHRRDGTRRQFAHVDQKRGVAAHRVLWPHRQTDDVPAALHALPGTRLGPALLLAQCLHRPATAA